MKGIYLDYAATTPVDLDVIVAMQPYLNQRFANPSSLHQQGISNRKIINEARISIAKCINANPDEIFFTSGGTESTNMAIKGYAHAHPNKKEIITSKIEHHATIHSCEYLETLGYKVHYVPVDKYGFVSLKKLENLINENTLMVSIIWVNNEIGTIQDLKSISNICKKHQVALHVDAVQAFGQLTIDLEFHQVDFLTLSAHKFYGPKGIGILYIKKGTKIIPLIHGGGQEYNLRAGTENLSGIVGMAKAALLATQRQPDYYQSLLVLANKFYQRFMMDFDCILNGPEIGPRRLPSNLNLSFKGIKGNELTYWLDQNEIFVSTGSACNSTSIEPSHVLKAIKVADDYINGTIRISLGNETLESEIPKIIARFKEGIDSIIE